MAGLSTTHYDSATISIAAEAAGDTATATSGGTAGGRALSDVSHSSGGLRYFELEVVQLRSTLNTWTIGVVDNTSNLGLWLGGGTESGFLWRRVGQIERFVGGSPTSVHGVSSGDVGMRALVWVDPVSRKIWITATDRNGGRYGDWPARPDLGTGETWTIPDTGPLRVALCPIRGDGTTDANVLRFCSRYSQLRVRGAELLGALPWDARTATVVEDVSGVANGTVLRWAWFDESRPHLLTQPTSQGSVTVASGQVSVSVSTSLDAGGIGSLLLSNTDGAVVQCRSHYAPAVAP